MPSATKRRLLLLLVAGLILVVAASGSVKSVVALSPSPSPGWNHIKNGDFDQGTNGWTFATSTGGGGAGDCNVFSDGPGPDDSNYLWLKATCEYSNWYKSVMSQSIWLPLDPLLVFYATIREEPEMHESAATARINFQAYIEGRWQWVYAIDYVVSGAGGVPYSDPSVTTVLLSDREWTWLGVSDGHVGRNVYNDFRYYYPGFSRVPVVVSEVDLFIYVHGNFFSGQTSYAKFDGVRLGDYPMSPAVSINPTITEYDTSSASVTFSWSYDSPSLLKSDGGQGPLRGGVNYELSYEEPGLSGTVGGSGSSSYPITISSRGEYTAKIRAESVADEVWSGYTSFPGILNGYTLAVNTNWLCGAAGTATLTYRQHGSSHTHDLTASSNSWSVIIDPGSAASITQKPLDETNRRITTVNPTSWTVSSACAKGVSYYLQYQSSVSTSGLTSSCPATVTVQQCGAMGYPTTYGTWSDWVDANSMLTMNTTVTVTVNGERYHTPNAVSWTVNNYPFSASVKFYKQWKPTVTLSGTDSQHTVSATYALDDSPKTDTNVYSSWMGWVDNGATLTFNLETTGGSPSERWHAYNTRSWTVGSAMTPTITYTHQFSVTLNPLDHHGNPLAREVTATFTGDSQGGHGTYTESFSSLLSRWMDAGTQLGVGKLTTGSSLTDQWYCYNVTLSGDWRTLTVSSPQTLRLVYFHQFRPEIQLVSSQYGTKVYDNYTHIAVGDWICASAWLWDGDADARPSKVGAFTFKWITPSGQVLHMDSSSNCFTDALQAPQTYGEWTLQVEWSDGSQTTYNATTSFHIYDYSLNTSGAEDASGENINLAATPTLIGGNMLPRYSMLIAATTGTTATPYLKILNLVYGGAGLAKATSLSSSFFTTGMGTTWTAHIRNIDPTSSHAVAFSARVYDPVTGYTYMDEASSLALLGVGGEGELSLAFTPSSSWWRYAPLRVIYTFYVYDSFGGNAVASPVQNFGDSDPASWVMRGAGKGEVKAVYYLSGVNSFTSLTQLPVSLLANSALARFYFALEDVYSISTLTQVVPAAMCYLNVTCEGADVFATGCVPPSRWVAEGTSITLTTESPFHPKPPYYSTTRRFIFLRWNWSRGPDFSQWFSNESLSLNLNLAQPVRVIACWRTQFLVDFTPFVPTSAPADSVQVSYTANESLVTAYVRSTETVRAWVDAYTMFTMHNLWVNDYKWYAVDYDAPSKLIAGGTSLTLPYVEKTNKVEDISMPSSSFEAGGNLKLNVSLTTTHFCAEWANITILVTSKNAILADRSGVAWNNVKIPLLNNTALIMIQLPQDIGNGTLTIIVTAYGRAEPTTTQVTIFSPTPPREGVAIVDWTSIAASATVFLTLLGASLSIRRLRRRTIESESNTGFRQRSKAGNTPATTNSTATGSSISDVDDYLSGAGIIEFDTNKGPYLRTIIDKGSKFLKMLREDRQACIRYYGIRTMLVQDSHTKDIAILSSWITTTRGRGTNTDVAGRTIVARGSLSGGGARAIAVKKPVERTLVLCTKDPTKVERIQSLSEELSKLNTYDDVMIRLERPGKSGGKNVARTE